EDQEVADVASELAPGVNLEVRRFDEVISLLEGIDLDTKTKVLLANLEALFNDAPDEKVLIFTEFRETQDLLVEVLAERWTAHKFHGQLSVEQKEASVDNFRRGSGPQILISTEAGGEGRNFQFCHLLVN